MALYSLPLEVSRMKLPFLAGFMYKYFVTISDAHGTVMCQVNQRAKESDDDFHDRSIHIKDLLERGIRRGR